MSICKEVQRTLREGLGIMFGRCMALEQCQRWTVTESGGHHPESLLVVPHCLVCEAKIRKKDNSGCRGCPLGEFYGHNHVFILRVDSTGDLLYATIVIVSVGKARPWVQGERNRVHPDDSDRQRDGQGQFSHT
jgi:hypothetical protein